MTDKKPSAMDKPIKRASGPKPDIPNSQAKPGPLGTGPKKKPASVPADTSKLAGKFVKGLNKKIEGYEQAAHTDREDAITGALKDIRDIIIEVTK